MSIGSGSRCTVRDAATRSAPKAVLSSSWCCGSTRNLSSRWLRQNARAKAGSPHDAHSASSRIGPSAPGRMFLGLTSPCTKARRGVQVVESGGESGRHNLCIGRCQFGVPLCEGLKIGMHPQCDEQILGVNLCREGGVGGGALVNQPEPVTDCCGKRNIYSPREQLCLPQRMCCRVEVLHGNEVCALVGGKHGGAGTGHECVDSAEPVGFILTAFERCVPVTDGQFRERMFDHKASARGIHHPDVGGDPTGERGCLRGFVGADEPRLPKKTEIFSGKDPPTITVCLRHDRTYHAAVIPPSITRSVPVMNEAASLAR